MVCRKVHLPQTHSVDGNGDFHFFVLDLDKLITRRFLGSATHTWYTLGRGDDGSKIDSEVCRNMLGACLTFFWHFAVSSRPEDQGEAIASRLSESDPRVGG